MTMVDPYIEDFTSEDTIAAPHPEHVAMGAGVEDETAGIHSPSALLTRRPEQSSLPLISPLYNLFLWFGLLARTPTDPSLPLFSCKLKL